MSILLVCNEPSFRVVLGDLLREEGYEVDVSRNLDGAKRQIGREGYDLVILNLFDGGGAALQACKELKAIRAEQKVAFIQGRWTAIPAEACEHYLIPLQENTQQLLAKVAELLQRESPEPSRHTWEVAGHHVGS